jgi:hypothetical protein
MKNPHTHRLKDIKRSKSEKVYKMRAHVEEILLSKRIN